MRGRSTNTSHLSIKTDAGWDPSPRFVHFITPSLTDLSWLDIKLSFFIHCYVHSVLLDLWRQEEKRVCLCTCVCVFVHENVCVWRDLVPVEQTKSECSTRLIRCISFNGRNYQSWYQFEFGLDIITRGCRAVISGKISARGNYNFNIEGFFYVSYGKCRAGIKLRAFVCLFAFVSAAVNIVQLVLQVWLLKVENTSILKLIQVFVWISQCNWLGFFCENEQTPALKYKRLQSHIMLHQFTD